MDDIYEFKNNEYRLACMQIKATAYDIVTGITKKKAANLDELFKIRDKIVELTDSFEIELEKLDAQVESIKQQTSSDESPMITPEVAEKKSDHLIIPEGMNDAKLPITERTSEESKNQKTRLEQMTSTPIEQATDYQTSSENTKLPTVNSAVDQPAHSQNQEEKTAEEQTPQIIEADQKSEPTAVKKKFRKTTKKVSKAIMVRPNQLENLRNSRQFQEQILAKQGIFAMAEQIQQQRLNNQPKELPDEVERQIEDLTVKANVYYNEGELEKAQELYDQIKALNNQYQ